MFRKFLAALGLTALITTSAAAHDPAVRVERIESLTHSVARLLQNGNEICTVSKIAPKRFLTARHCVSNYPNAEFMVQYNAPSDEGRGVISSLEYAIVTSVHVGGRSKGKGGRGTADWAVLYVDEGIESMRELRFECVEPPRMGQDLATMGYPSPMGRYYSEGFISSLEDTTGANPTLRSWDFYASLLGAPGSSGAPVVSLTSGRLVGIMVGGVVTRVGPIAAGMQATSIRELCSIYGDQDNLSTWDY